MSEGLRDGQIIKVSVIVPVYNTAGYLPRCIESILGQSLTELELLLVDDGSEDDSYDVCEQYARRDARIRLFRKKNGGASSARNMALEHVKGEFIVFVDSDDYILPDILKKSYEALKKENMRLAVFGIHYDYNQRGCGDDASPLLRAEDTGDVKSAYFRMNNEELMKNYLLDKPYYVGTIVWNKMYDAALWRERRQKEGIMNEDADMMYRLLGEIDEALYLRETGYVQCVRQGSVTNRTFHPGRMNSLNICDDLKQFIKEHYQEKMYGYAVLSVGIDCKFLLREIIEAGIQNNPDSYEQVLEYYRSNNKELRRWWYLDIKKSIRILGTYYFRNINWIVERL